MSKNYDANRKKAEKRIGGLEVTIPDITRGSARLLVKVHDLEEKKAREQGYVGWSLVFVNKGICKQELLSHICDIYVTVIVTS